MSDRCTVGPFHCRRSDHVVVGPLRCQTVALSDHFVVGGLTAVRHSDFRLLTAARRSSQKVYSYMLSTCVAIVGQFVVTLLKALHQYILLVRIQ